MDQARIEMLERLANLYRSGSLTEAEYAAQKARLLADGGEARGGESGDGAGEPVLASGEEEIDRFRGTTTGWLLGSLQGWGTILLCLAWPAAWLAADGLWPQRIALALTLAGLGVIGWRYWRNIGARYVLTSQRLVMHTGIFLRRVDEIELFRIKDVRVDYSLVNQLTGIGRITLRTSDPSSHQADFVLHNVPDAVELRETIRMLVDKERQRRRVRELDIDEWGA